jgi:hypothetical protein
MAMFGPTATIAAPTSTGLRITAEIEFLHDNYACTAIPITKKAKDTQEKNFILKWWKSDGGEPVSSPYQGKIVVVRRGSCSFEDKAANMQQAGASAVVIENNEELLFVMAARGGPGTGGTVVSEDDDVTVDVPTVMLTQFDSRSLLTDLELLKSRGYRVFSQLDIKKSLNMLDLDAFGSLEYPKGSATPTVISVLSSGCWGVKLWAIDKKWQVTLINKYGAPGVLHNELEVETGPAGLKQSTNAYGSMSALEMYRLHVSEQCTAVFSFDEDTMIMKIDSK